MRQPLLKTRKALVRGEVVPSWAACIGRSARGHTFVVPRRQRERHDCRVVQPPARARGLLCPLRALRARRRR